MKWEFELLRDTRVRGSAGVPGDMMNPKFRVPL